MIQGDNAKSVLGFKEFGLEKGVLTVVEPEGTSTFDASKLLKITQSPRAFFLYRDAISAIIFPVEGENYSCAEAEAFVAEIKKQMGSV